MISEWQLAHSYLMVSASVYAAECTASLAAEKIRIGIM